MDGKICVVTGASSGIGRATAVALARLGATVVLACRDQGRGEPALAEVAAAATGGPPSLELADFTSMDQVRELAGRLGTLPAIDVLVNNAGLVVGRREVTADGFEHTIAVNHLAPFLLTSLLMAKLTASGAARVVTVASIAHRSAMLRLDDLNSERRYLPMLAYSNSKLANVLFTRELARRLAEAGPGVSGTAVTANCLHPGTVATRFGRTGSAWLRYGVIAGRYFLRSPASGAATSVYLASSPQVAGRSGGYYVRCRLHQPSPAARNDTLARDLWDLSARLTGLTDQQP